MALTRGVLGRAVGLSGQNDRNDVIGMKRLMQELGLYRPPEGLHDAIDADFDRAIREFQEKNGLKMIVPTPSSPLVLSRASRPLRLSML